MKKNGKALEDFTAQSPCLDFQFLGGMVSSAASHSALSVNYFTWFFPCDS